MSAKHDKVKKTKFRAKGKKIAAVLFYTHCINSYGQFDVKLALKASRKLLPQRNNAPLTSISPFKFLCQTW
jgi:homospermidine synthase